MGKVLHLVELPEIYPSDIAFVINTVCDEFYIARFRLFRVNRQKEFVFPRQIAMYGMYRFCENVSYPKIGKIFNKDHSTVHYSVALIEKNLQEYAIDIKLSNCIGKFNTRLGLREIKRRVKPVIEVVSWK